MCEKQQQQQKSEIDGLYSKSAIYRDPNVCGCGCGATTAALNLAPCMPTTTTSMPLCPPNLNLSMAQARHYYPSQMHCTTVGEPVSIQCVVQQQQQQQHNSSSGCNRKSMPMECVDMSPPSTPVLSSITCHRTSNRCVSPPPSSTPCHRSRCASPVLQSNPCSVPCLPKPVYYEASPDCRQSRYIQ